jgi:coenzyme Q-binding protein COQ10
VLRQSIERELPYTPGQLFDIAADVSTYPEFLPWWIAVRVRDRNETGYCTDQVLGLGPVRMTFASTTVLDPPSRIDVASSDRAFRQFRLSWLFHPLRATACRVGLAIELDLRSRLLQALLEGFARDTAGDIMSAFESRADRLYG